MPNILDYVNGSTDSFEQRPLCPADALVFSWLANLRIPEEEPQTMSAKGVPICNLGMRSNVLGFVAPVHDPANSERLLRACATSPRFGLVVACLAADEWSRSAEKQFSAVTFLLPQGAVIAFRGTDDTLVGWKENFNMSFRGTVPAQESAQAYVESVATSLRSPLWLCGHSKGGNLAMYATACCDPLSRLRIERCYAFDAPGLSRQVIESSFWKDAVPLIERVVPEESLVGLLWDSGDLKTTIVRSENTGVMQHAPLSWVVQGNDFATAKALSYDAYRNGRRLGAWMETLSTADRERFVEILYKLARATGEVTFSGLLDALGPGSLDLVLRRLDGLPASDRAFFTSALEDLGATMLLGPAPKTPVTPQEKADAASERIDDITARFNSASSRLDELLGL